MAKLESMAIFVGTGKCNANCAHCAGKPLRKHAPNEDGIVDENRIITAARECHKQGARQLSISSSGEPTLSPKSITRSLELISELKPEGIIYSPINLYSNGIKIGTDHDFCFYYLNLWRQLGLTQIYLTVHDIDEKKNAAIYRCEKYPRLEQVIFETHMARLKLRANLVLSKENISDCDQFSYIVNKLKLLGADSVAAWPIRDMTDKVDQKLAPEKDDLERMARWAEMNSNPEYKIRVQLENSHERYSKGEKLTLFPDGSLTNSWCK